VETWETEVKPERSDIEEFRAENKRAEEQWEHSYPELLRKNGYYTPCIGKYI
jgi:arylsulfatase A-like enzyme